MGVRVDVGGRERRGGRGVTLDGYSFELAAEWMKSVVD